MLDVKEDKLLRYSFRSGTSAPDSTPMIITIKLSPDDNGHMLLTLQQEKIADEATKTHSAEYWQIAPGKLKYLLEKNENA